jgi:hypothetical protein
MWPNPREALAPSAMPTRAPARWIRSGMALAGSGAAMQLRVRLCHAFLQACAILAFAGCSQALGPMQDAPAPDASVPDQELGAGDFDQPEVVELGPPQSDVLGRPSLVPQPTAPVATCPWGSGLLADDGEPVPTVSIEEEPELIHGGRFWSLSLGQDALYAIEGPQLNARSSVGADVTRYELDSLERSVVFSANVGGLVEPSAILVHGTQLYVDDWSTRTLHQSAIDGHVLEVLAEDAGSTRALSFHAGSVFVSDYPGGRVLRVHDPSAEQQSDAGDVSVLDPATTVVEQLSQVPYPAGSAAWRGHVAWGTYGHDAHLDNQLVVRSLEAAPDEDQRVVALDVDGSIAAIDASEQELSWAVYGVEGSALSRATLDDSGALDAQSVRTLRVCGQPIATALHGTLAVYGTASGVVLWDRDAGVVSTLAAGIALAVQVDDAHVYYATADGLYRVTRP